MGKYKNNCYINREISWLSFNERVLMEALDNSNPLMEKLKFTAIFSSNLDEFFMVRVASLKDQISAGITSKDIAGLTHEEQLEAISVETRKLLKKQQKIFIQLKEELEKNGYYFNPEIVGKYDEITEYIFIDEIKSVISPVTLDPAHPFPFIYNKRISIIVSLEKDGKNWYSLIMLPENLRRYFKVQVENKKAIFTTEEIIKKHIQKLYRGFEVKNVNVFRITRNADMEVRQEDMADMIHTMKDFLSRRTKGNVTRIEIEENTPTKTVQYLKEMIQFEDVDVIYLDGVIDLTFLFGISNMIPSMQFPVHKSFEVEIPSNSDVFNTLKEKDIYSFRPYYSFSIVSKIIDIAAEDPDVLAIKMTLYRTNSNSSILASLVKAAKSGKQVSVVIELKARFDEERNIDWAKNLEDAGCIVTYGIVGLKIHAKCLLIVRREKNTIKRYTHIATGNYNEKTAALYTDIDLITSNEAIGRDAAQLFNYLMAYTAEEKWQTLSVAPFNLRKNILKLFDNEISIANLGGESHVIMKMNSLIDKEIINKMYDASCAGVKIDLIVRGICGLKAGVEGYSENIRVRSIIGRFLEHARIFYFKNGNNPRYFISSADMMPRNLNKRVELMTEINDESLKHVLSQILETSLLDNTKSWELKGDKFVKIEHGPKEKTISSQEYFMKNKLI